MDTTLYRIIDANFNRGREALRVMEEYCRFGLNHAGLSATAKQLRHRLCECIGRFDTVKLLASRDTAGDVGRQMKVDGQLSRTSLEDCFTAGAKRASEALRALAEASQALDPQTAAVMEQLRFGVYALEKETVLYANVRRKLEPVRLYVLVSAGNGIEERSVLHLAEQCIQGGADCLQLRAKNISDSALLSLARQFTELCRSSNVVSIMNDRADIAVLAEADGVHLGQEDISAQDARKLNGRLILGGSTHSVQELRQAMDSGYHYVGVGPAFASPTKPQVQVAGLNFLQQASQLLQDTSIYAVAIGGIDETNLDRVLATGIRRIAVSSSVSGCPNPMEYCKKLKKRLLF